MVITGGRSMLTALILVCSVAVTPELRECDRTNAVYVLRLPEETGNPVICMMHGQAYLAGTAIGRELREDERIKVMCVRAVSGPARDARAR
jgi:hypothetical protein